MPDTDWSSLVHETDIMRLQTNLCIHSFIHSFILLVLFEKLCVTGHSGNDVSLAQGTGRRESRFRGQPVRARVKARDSVSCRGLQENPERLRVWRSVLRDRRNKSILALTETVILDREHVLTAKDSHCKHQIQIQITQRKSRTRSQLRPKPTRDTCVPVPDLWMCGRSFVPWNNGRLLELFISQLFWLYFAQLQVYSENSERKRSEVKEVDMQLWLRLWETSEFIYGRPFPTHKDKIMLW